VTDDIARLATEYHDFRQCADPISAHLHGDYRFADRAEEVSRAAEEAEIAESRAFAARAEAIAPDTLTDQDCLTRELIAWDGGVRAVLAEARLAEITVDPNWGPVALLPVQLTKLSLPSVDVADAMPAKLRGIARLFRDLGDRLREGKARGRLPVRVLVEQTITELDGWLAKPVDLDPLVVAPSPAIADPEDWTAGLRAVIGRDVRPALAEYRDVLRDELLVAARPEDRAGLCWIPDGDDAYARAIRSHATLSKSPGEIHEIGLAQVARLAEEYREIGSQALGTTDLERILESLRSDPALHQANGLDIVEASETALAKARAAMPGWFGIVPKADCHVEEVKTGAAAYCFAPATDGTRGGVVFWNTSDAAGRPPFVVESVTYHEGIPGHHLQLTIAAEREEIPEFRRWLSIDAYAEGWALYAERLADEMGLYSSPLDRLGMLGNDSLRACRLVIDTGMHALGWSRRRAIEYLLRNSPLPEGLVTAEIDFDIANPGQALAYMLGRLEIEQMRADARPRLSERFDVKAFHDAVLGAGALPLPILGRVVHAWVAEAAAA
jgi:uncharacterized protein (DUF885 family)